MHVKALVDTVATTLAETKAVILAITMGDIVVEALAERLAVTLKKAECQVETLSDAVTDAPSCRVANKLEEREAEALVKHVRCPARKKGKTKHFGTQRAMCKLRNSCTPSLTRQQWRTHRHLAKNWFFLKVKAFLEMPADKVNKTKRGRHCHTRDNLDPKAQVDKLRDRRCKD